MTMLTRRTLSLLGLLSPLARQSRAAEAPAMDHTMPDMGPVLNAVPWVGHEEIAMLMYPGMTVLDLIGPQAMFASMMGARVHLVAKTMAPVTSDAGVTITPTATFETCPKDLTILFAPGGTEGTLAAARDPATIAFMADRGARATYVTSVCSGSLILGKARLLRGYRATSHWSCRDALAGFGAIPTDERVVQDRNRITGAGVTAGLDLGLAIVGKLRGRIYAECTQLVDEYDPEPPYDAGSLKTAPEEVKRAMTALLAGFSRQADALAGVRPG